MQYDLEHEHTSAAAASELSEQTAEQLLDASPLFLPGAVFNWTSNSNRNSDNNSDSNSNHNNQCNHNNHNNNNLRGHFGSRLETVALPFFCVTEDGRVKRATLQWPRSHVAKKCVRSCIEKFRCADGTWLGPRANGCVCAGGRCVPVDLTIKMRHLTLRWSMTDHQPPEGYIQTRQHRSYLTPSRPNHTTTTWRRAHVARVRHALRTPLAGRATVHGTVHMSSWCVCVEVAATQREEEEEEEEEEKEEEEEDEDMFLESKHRKKDKK